MDVWSRVTSRGVFSSSLRRMQPWITRNPAMSGLLSHRASAVNRLTVLSVLLVLWGAAIFSKLIVLQVLQHGKYSAIARSQQEHEVDIPAPRGTILDRNGQPLAISVPDEIGGVFELLLSEIERAADRAERIFGITPNKSMLTIAPAVWPLR